MVILTMNFFFEMFEKKVEKYQYNKYMSTWIDAGLKKNDWVPSKNWSSPSIYGGHCIGSHKETVLFSRFENRIANQC